MNNELALMTVERGRLFTMREVSQKGVSAGVILIVLAFAAGAFSQGALRTIVLVTEPKTIVWVDGVRYGRTGADGRLEIKTIAAGPHTLRFRADGFKEKSQPLTAAQRGEINIALVKTTDAAELAYQEGERLAFVDREKSAEAYNRAIKLKPNYPEAYVALARVLAEAQDVEDARKAITTARRLRAGYAEASAVEGRILKDAGEEAKAILAFKRAITEGRGFQAEAYAGLGLLYKERAEGASAEPDAQDTNYAEAAKYLKLSIKQLSGAPDAVVIYQLLGLIYERQKKTTDAIALYEEFLRLFPDAPEASAVRSFIVQLNKARLPQN